METARPRPSRTRTPEAKRAIRRALSDCRSGRARFQGVSCEEDRCPHRGQRIRAGRSIARRWRSAPQVVPQNCRGLAFSTPSDLRMTINDTELTQAQPRCATIAALLGRARDAGRRHALGACLRRTGERRSRRRRDSWRPRGSSRRTSRSRSARACRMSGHIMVAMASLVVFWDHIFFPGPRSLARLVGSTCSTLRKREFSKIVDQLGDRWHLSTGRPSSRSGSWPIRQAMSILGLLAAMASAAATYAVVDSLLLSIPVAALSEERYGAVAVARSRAINVIGLPFALFGLGFGWAYVRARVPGCAAVARTCLHRASHIRELPGSEGGAGADDRDVDPCARGEGSVHGRARAARGDVRGVRG